MSNLSAWSLCRAGLTSASIYLNPMFPPLPAPSTRLTLSPDLATPLIVVLHNAYLQALLSVHNAHLQALPSVHNDYLQALPSAPKAMCWGQGVWCCASQLTLPASGRRPWWQPSAMTHSWHGTLIKASVSEMRDLAMEREVPVGDRRGRL